METKLFFNDCLRWFVTGNRKSTILFEIVDSKMCFFSLSQETLTACVGVTTCNSIKQDIFVHFQKKLTRRQINKYVNEAGIGTWRFVFFQLFQLN